MPNQTSVNALTHYETISQNLSYIDSLTALIIDSQSGCTDKNDIDNVMLMIGIFQREASEANKRFYQITKGG